MIPLHIIDLILLRQITDNIFIPVLHLIYFCCILINQIYLELPHLVLMFDFKFIDLVVINSCIIDDSLISGFQRIDLSEIVIIGIDFNIFNTIFALSANILDFD